MKPPVRKKEIERFWNPGLWIYVLVDSVVSGLTAAAVGRCWGEAAGFCSFFLSAMAFPVLIGIALWIDDDTNGGKGSDRSLDELV
jgi:hypothetical protein